MGGTESVRLPHFTTSADAALALIPPEFRIATLSEWDVPSLPPSGPWVCILARRADSSIREMGDTRSNNAFTMDIAICIAALRARGGRS